MAKEKTLLESEWVWSYVTSGSNHFDPTGQYLVWAKQHTSADVLFFGTAQAIEVAHDPKLGSRDVEATALCEHIVSLHNTSLPEEPT